eukprot:CFRG6295T1
MLNVRRDITVKWGRDQYTLEAVDLRKDVRFLKDQLYTLTKVRPNRQKILAKGKIVQNGSNLDFFVGAQQLVVTMMGSNDVIEVPPTVLRFVEDMSEAEKQEELRRFMRNRDSLSQEDRRKAEHFIESIPGMPDFHTYDFTSPHSINLFRTDISKRNVEALHLANQALRVEFACISNDLDLLKSVAITNYHPAYSPLALSASGLVRTAHPLAHAVANGNVDMARYILNEGRISIPTSSRIFRGRRELVPFIHTAAAKNDIAMMRILLTYHADPYEVAHKMCPVSVACFHGHGEAVEFILQYRMQRGEGACKREMEINGDFWLRICAKNKNLNVAKLLVGRYLSRDFLKKESTTDSTSLTPIHVAAEYGTLSFLRWAIEDHYIDPDVSQESDVTPLGMVLSASEYTPNNDLYKAVLRYLISEGASKRRVRSYCASHPNHWLLPTLLAATTRALSLRRLCYLKMRRCNLPGLREEDFTSAFPSERRPSFDGDGMDYEAEVVDKN